MGSQIWSMEKLENKLIDMRDMYEERKDSICNRLTVIKVFMFITNIMTSNDCIEVHQNIIGIMVCCQKYLL